MKNLQDYGQFISDDTQSKSSEQAKNWNPSEFSRSVANTIGNSAETAKQLGLTKDDVHRIVDTAYAGGSDR